MVEKINTTMSVEEAKKVVDDNILDILAADTSKINFTKDEISKMMEATKVLGAKMLELESSGKNIPEDISLYYKILKEQQFYEGRLYIYAASRGNFSYDGVEMKDLLDDYWSVNSTGTDGILYTYYSYKDGITVTGYEGTSKDIVIPDDIMGVPIVNIDGRGYDFEDRGVFEGKGIQSVKLGNNIKRIGYGAFEDNQITELVLGEGIEIIDDDAFQTNLLTTLHIGKNVTEIGNNAFQYNKLSQLTFSPEIDELDIDMDTFMDNNLTKVVLPKNTTFLKNWSDGATTYPYYSFDKAVEVTYYP